MLEMTHDFFFGGEQVENGMTSRLTSSASSARMLTYSDYWRRYR